MDSSMNTEAPDETTRVFVSYAREDKKWLDRDYRFNLIPFLSESLKRQNVVFWFDKDLRPGDEFRNHIEAEIDHSQIALLIVSQAFLNSEFIEKYEMTRIVNRAKMGQMIIVPVLVEPCDWSEYPVLADRQMVPGSMPLIDFTESDPKWAKVKAEILDGLKTQIKRIRATQPLPQSPTDPVNQLRDAAQFYAASIPDATDARPSVPKGEESNSGWRKVPTWGWVLVLLALVAVFAVGRLAVLHHDSVGSATPPTNSTPAISQPAIQQAPAYSPRVNPKPPVQTPNLAAMKQQADALTNQNNFAQAATLYEELCLAGNGPSCNRAGYQYQNGLGVKVDDARAANLYSRSCNFGYPNGCSNLGNLYRQGLGVPRNLVLARQYLTQGCNMGNPFGCNILKQLQ
jgi:hypothetical protein